MDERSPPKTAEKSARHDAGMCLIVGIDILRMSEGSGTESGRAAVSGVLAKANGTMIGSVCGGVGLAGDSRRRPGRRWTIARKTPRA